MLTISLVLGFKAKMQLHVKYNRKLCFSSLNVTDVRNVNIGVGTKTELCLLVGNCTQCRIISR